MYSWYPAPVKRYFEKPSVTTQPHLANFARYPAVHWFTYGGLRRYLGQSEMLSFDRFDLMDTSRSSALARVAIGAARHFRLVRWMGHVMTPGTSVVAMK